MREELLDFIKQLISNKNISSFDEAATKQAVILPILSKLGWNTFNIDEVKPEYSVGGQKVDYALRNTDVNKVFIEVKKISEDLEKHQQQLLNYAFKEGVRLAVLTNGLSWQFYLPLREGSWEQRKFYTIEINDQNIENIADRYIDYIGKENVCSEKAVQNAEAVYKSKQRDRIIIETIPKAWTKLISEPDELLIDLIADATEKLCGFKPDNSTVAKFVLSNSSIYTDNTKLFRDKELVDKQLVVKTGNYTGKSVSAFIFKNKRQKVKYWIDVLIEVCKLMRNLYNNSFERILELRGRKKPYFSKNADELRIPYQIADSDIYMETNLSANSIVRISISVISLFGYSDDDFTIESH